MDVLSQFLDDHEKRRTEEAEADRRWMEERGGIDPAERLIKWEKWLRDRLRRAFQWPEDEVKKEKLVGQCMAEITKMVRQIHGRGWLLDGKSLTILVNALLGPIAIAQQQGKIRKFWPYFRTSVADFVGQHAEQIQMHARQNGSDIGFQSIGSTLKGLGFGPGQGPTMTELITQKDDEVKADKSLREKQRALRKKARCTADAQQGQLL